MYIASSSKNVIGKLILQRFPYPVTVTIVELASISVYSVPLFSALKVRRQGDISWTYYVKFIVPLALGKVSFLDAGKIEVF